jgi:arylsulfatase A-like enzyme
LLITTDQQRRDSLGCYSRVVHREFGRVGGFRARTPHLDRLAAEGLRVDDAWAAAPVRIKQEQSLGLGTGESVSCNISLV